MLWIRNRRNDRSSKTINNWLDAVVNLLKDEKYSNGFAEANNNTIDKIIDRAYGYKNFEFFRLRTLAILHKSYSKDIRKNPENDDQKKVMFFRKNSKKRWKKREKFLSAIKTLIFPFIYKVKTYFRHPTRKWRALYCLLKIK